jgi:glycosyltransferase involved in cell wall biosynthesis
MRILITTDTIGGVWTFTQELAAGLLERENDVLLVSFGRMPSAAQQRQCELLLQRFGKRFRHVATEVPLEWMERNERAFEDGARVLEREAALFAPEILHANQFCYGALDVSVPRVVTAHSDVLSWAKACRKEPLDDTAWLRSYIAQVQAGLSAAEAVVAPTRWMMNAAAESFALPECRAVIPNGRAIMAKFDGTRALRAVTAGRLWDEAKGLSLLSQVVSPVPVLVAGESRHESASSPESGGARLLGQLAETQMLELLKQSAIYLCLSVYEPFGLAPLEAARCGCAVVARDIPSLQEVWEDGALFFRDAAELSEILGRMARDAQFLERARRRSFERSQYFSRDRMVEKYCKLFQKLQAELVRTEHVA